MAQPVDSAPPGHDEFEVSLFGPGYGESSVVHLGNGKWLINDSCLSSDKKSPAALLYLSRLGVDVSQDVRIVIASHWHDDHIRGLSQIVNECDGAEFCCSSALQSDEFLALVRAGARDSSKLGSGVRELSQIICTLTDRNERGIPSVRWARSDSLIWRHGEIDSVEVHTLAPSDASQTHSLLEIANLAQQVQQTRNRIPKLEQNSTSVVVWIDFGVDRVLLGADLETTSNDVHRGWRAICNSNTRPRGRAGVYKVAHHGSVTGHHDQLYGLVLEDTPMSILAPFRRGSVQLPTDQDRVRICRLSSGAYSTVEPNTARSKQRDNVVARTIREMGIRVELIDPRCGQVRLRRRVGDPRWNVALFDSAGSLCE